MRSPNVKHLEVTRSFEGGVCVVRLLGTEYGSLDAGKLASVRSLLLDLVSDQAPRCLVLDVSNVHFFGAGFVSVLVDTWDRLSKGGRRLALCGLTPYCGKLIRILHLDKLFAVYPTSRAALEDMGEHIHGPGEQARIAPIRVHLSEVAWDPDMVRVEYVGDDDFAIRSVIRPRQRPTRAGGCAIRGDAIER